MYSRPPLLEEPFAQTLSGIGKTCSAKQPKKAPYSALTYTVLHPRSQLEPILKMASRECGTREGKLGTRNFPRNFWKELISHLGYLSLQIEF